MGQPIRKVVKDNNEELMKGDEPFYTLLIDGGALLFMCMKDPTVNSEGMHVGGIFQFLLQMRMMMSKRDFDYVYVTFDDEYSGWLRWKLYNQYKANRDKHYEEYGMSDYMKAYNETLNGMMRYNYAKNQKNRKDKPESEKSNLEKLIENNFDRERNSLMRYFEELYVRTLMDDVVEGDDFIAYYCKNKKPNERIYIMTGDMDLTQLLADDIAIYNIHLKKFITNKNFKENFGYHYENTLIKKIFCGDSSDNIGNIKGLSEDGFKKLMPEFVNKKVTFDEVIDRAKKLIDERINDKKKPLAVHENIVNGIANKDYDGDFYEINKKIIDLSEPLLTDSAKEEIDSMMHAPQDPEGRSIKNLYRYILEDGIDELKGDTKFASFFSLFKKLEEKEIKRYKELCSKD